MQIQSLDIYYQCVGGGVRPGAPPDRQTVLPSSSWKIFDYADDFFPLGVANVLHAAIRFSFSDTRTLQKRIGLEFSKVSLNFNCG